MERVRNLFRRSAAKDAPAPKATALLDLCMKTIQNVAAQYSSWSTEEDRTKDYLMNRDQCNFLVGRLTDTRGSLEKIRLSPLLDKKTIPVLKELRQVLLDVEAVIKASRITSSQWPRAAMEQSDMKETFARLLYGVQWHVSVLLSILVDNSRESSITFEPSSCEGELSAEDELSLLTAMKEDEESLKDRLRSVKLDDPTEKRLANELLKLKMQSEEEDHLNASSEFPESSGALKDSSESALIADDLTGFSSSADILYLNPEDLDLDGIQIGIGASAKVRKTNLLGGKYAIKIFDTDSNKEFDQEMDALQRLGRHPHIVRLLGYSKESTGADTECFLIMEEMDMDLYTIFKNYRKRNKCTPVRPLSDVQAVSLMLQIGEGVKYIHSKRMAHHDLKSGNVLLNLAHPSSKRFISSVKIADFGLTKTKNATHTYSNQTLNQGTSKWMAPEVIQLMQGADEKMLSKFNLRKADVYSFAIICFEILTGEDPYHGLNSNEIKGQVKVGTLRPKLPQYCPPKLAALIERCWHPISQERPLFPEICKELRYIKGLLLRGDRGKLEIQDICPLGSLERAKFQGPWGGDGGHNFFDVGTSMRWMKFRYNQSPGRMASMEVNYNVAGGKLNMVRTYANANLRWGDLHAEIEFVPFEFVTHISGYVSKTHMGTLGYIDNVSSLTIHTNIKSYGPFGEEKGTSFASEKGRVVGFHGRGGAVLDRLGVVVLLGDTS